uniref:Gypsy retrotransposon integrase-like protein 1 n=1 Tax=Paramormyrops kingsleyae TaxID=1676925 RepID=A0A3B3SBH5_9TELE
MDPAGSLENRISAMEQLLTARAAQVPLPGSPPRPSVPPPIALPERYDGDPDQCRGFLMQVGLYVEEHPEMFTTSGAEVRFTISLLTGRAREWATALWTDQSPLIRSGGEFHRALMEIFDHPAVGRRPGFRLLDCRQGNRTAADFSLEFRTIAAALRWPDDCLQTIFLRALNPDLQDELTSRGEVSSFDELVRQAVRLDNTVRDRRRRRSQTDHMRALPAPGSESTEPMQIGRSPLTTTERRRRTQGGLCLYCGGVGHAVSACPVRPRREEPPLPVGVFSVSLSSLTQLTVPVSVWYNGAHRVVRALLDSGAAGNFMDANLARQLRIPFHQLAFPIKVQGVTGEHIREGTIEHRTHPFMLTVGALHTEQMEVYVLPQAKDPLILGLPWLRKHNPSIDWRAGEITSWSELCLGECLSLPCKATGVESPEPEDLSVIPEEYRDYADVFSKEKAFSLPPRRDCDCAIDILAGTSMPRGRLYPISLQEQDALETYIREGLRQGIIRPSTSPMTAGFFFVKKKDGGLRPVIDYRALNAVSVKRREPLPLIPSALEQVREAVIFTKLDLRSAYNLVRIRKGDEWKTSFITSRGQYEYRVMPYGLANSPSIFQSFMNGVFHDMLDKFVIVYIDDILIYSPSKQAHVRHVKQVLQRLREHHLYAKGEKCEFHQGKVKFLGYVIQPGEVAMDGQKITAIMDWPPPRTLKELQRFLGFANFYRRFIRNFSQTAAPLTSLTRGKPTRLPWTSVEEQAFDRLKRAFCTAPILKQPRPELPFEVEVDASESGVGAVLIQRDPETGRRHPCAYFSRKLSSAERNYDVGDRELLAMKLALEEWRHWLEGARHPFLVLTDHRNLEYLQSAKRLSARQARWAHWFSRFSFRVSYLPGEKNRKADALSRQYDPPENEDRTVPILDPSCFVSSITWGLEERIRLENENGVAPSGCPPGLRYVSRAHRLPLLNWIHSQPGTGHPGVSATQRLVSRRYWWPRWQQEVRAFVDSCPECARNKSSNLSPAGLLQPLPVPSRPWSHVVMDFITDLPRSAGKTIILTIVDRFSKMCRLVPLPKLPSAAELADVLIQELFRFTGIPEDIVSDRGPQFASRVFREFCQKLNITLSLTSSYHPQSNGLAERTNREVSKALRLLVRSNPAKWTSHLVWAEYSLNSRVSPITALTPFQCVLGFQPPLFPWDAPVGTVPKVDAWYQESQSAWRRIQRA